MTEVSVQQTSQSIGDDIIHLAETSTDATNEKMDKIRKEIEEAGDNIELLKDLLIRLNRDLANIKDKVDYSNDPDVRYLIDKIREINSSLIEEGKYEFALKDLEALKENLQAQIGTEQSAIQPKMTQMTQALHEQNEIMDILKMMIETLERMMQKIGSNFVKR